MSSYTAFVEEGRNAGPCPSVGTWIERRARVAPGHTALIYGNTRRTYAELATRVRRLARGLRSLGVQRGDRVAWLGPNHPAFLEAFFAVAKIGAVLTPINYRLEDATIAAIYEDVAPRVVIRDVSLACTPRHDADTAEVRVAPGDAPDSEYEQLIARSADSAIDEPVAFDDLLFLPFTSGTTGLPKGVMLSHGNVTWNAINVLSSVDVRANDVTVAVAPFYRSGGTGVNVLPVLLLGGTVVIPSRAGAGEIVRLMEHHRVTIGFGNPDLLDALTQSSDWHVADLASLRLFITGGSPVSQRLLRRCHARGVTVLEGYGLSEAAPFVTVLDEANARRKIGSVGRPAPFVDVRIVRHDGSEAAAGEMGELRVRGPNVMAGYWRRPEASSGALVEHGWLRTGDVAYADTEGFVFIVGRTADQYMSGGMPVHPGVAERVLLQHGEVADAAVVGGDAGAVAYVALEPWAGAGVETELQLRCREQLPVHARPAAIVVVPSLPKNPAGKVRRELLRGSWATQ